MQKPDRLKSLDLVEWRSVLEECENIINDPSTYLEDPPQADNILVSRLMESIYGPDVWKYIYNKGR